jgi:heat shock protein HslJ
MTPLPRLACAALGFALASLAPAAADTPPAPGLTGAWVAQEVVGERMVYHIPPTLVFTDATHLSGDTQCSSYSARYDRYGEQGLSIRALIRPHHACADAVSQARANRYFNALEDVNRMELRSDGALVLRTPIHGSITFRRAAE